MHAYCKHWICNASGLSFAQDINVVCLVVKPNLTKCSLGAHSTVWVTQLARGQVTELAKGG